MPPFLDPSKPIERTRGRNLPHWFQPDATVHAVFRLADSLPSGIACVWRAKRAAWLRVHGVEPDQPGWQDRLASLPEQQRAEYHRRVSESRNGLLDRGHGSCELDDAPAAVCVAEALRHRDGATHRLHRFIVAANHVHVVFTPIGDGTAVAPVSGWKRYAAGAIDRLLGRRGRLWQAEAYDRLVRSAPRFDELEAYLLAHRGLHGTGATA